MRGVWVRRVQIIRLTAPSHPICSAALISIPALVIVNAASRSRHSVKALMLKACLVTIRGSDETFKHGDVDAVDLLELELLHH